MNLEDFNAARAQKVAPDTNLQILISGLTLCRFDKASKQWKLSLPLVPNHTFRMIVAKKNSDNRTIEEKTYELSPASKIEVITDDKKGGCKDNPQLSEDMINVCHLHGESLPLITDPSKYAGTVVLNGITLKAKTDAALRIYEIWEVKPFPNPTIKKLKKKHEFSGTIDCGTFFTPGLTTEIRVESDTTFTIPLLHEKDIIYQVTFDNDCHTGEKCDPLDFRFYYNIVDEKKLKTKQRFEVIMVPDPEGKFPDGSCLTCPTC